MNFKKCRQKVIYKNYYKTREMKRIKEYISNILFNTRNLHSYCDLISRTVTGMQKYRSMHDMQPKTKGFQQHNGRKTKNKQLFLSTSA